jgi:NAD(P)-dependent dehydrogenase (short-subunit alcohol dehydrogenase family)
LWPCLADLTHAAEVGKPRRQILAQFGRIDILVVNSGHVDYWRPRRPHRQPNGKSAYDLILMSCVRLTRALHSRRCARTQGRGHRHPQSPPSVKEPPPNHLFSLRYARLGVVGTGKTLRVRSPRTTSAVNVVVRPAISIRAGSKQSASAR